MVSKKNRSSKSRSNGAGPLAIVLTGGGARAAYQVGVLRALSRHRPDLELEILTGVSAGGINAVHLASHQGSFFEAVQDLTALWSRLEAENIFRVDLASLAKSVVTWGTRLVSGGAHVGSRVRGLVDTNPLAELLRETLPLAPSSEVIAGIGENLERGRLTSVALTTLDYSTGHTITWVEGCELCGWEGPSRRGEQAKLTVSHVMASAALPLFFPAIRLRGHWHGDGGIRLSAPLSPALHLGAGRVLVVSTRFPGNDDANEPVSTSYPPPAQILGHLTNSIFLDLIDQDILRLERLNSLLTRLPERKRGGLRPVEMLALRPSENLGRLAGEFEPKLPNVFRFLTRGLGTKEARSPDLLSLILFQPDYLERLMAIGDADAEARMDELLALVD